MRCDSMRCSFFFQLVSHVLNFSFPRLIKRTEVTAHFLVEDIYLYSNTHMTYGSLDLSDMLLFKTLGPVICSVSYHFLYASLLYEYCMYMWDVYIKLFRQLPNCSRPFPFAVLCNTTAQNVSIDERDEQNVSYFTMHCVQMCRIV